MRSSFLHVLNVHSVGTKDLVLEREAEMLGLSKEFSTVDAILKFTSDLNRAYEEGRTGSRHHFVVSLEIQSNSQET